MSNWLVRLKGHEFDLEELTDHFTSANRNVRKDQDGHYYLRSEDLNQMTDSDAVRKRALELMERMNGAMKYHSGGSYRLVEFDGLTEIDASGQRRNYVFLSSVIEGRSRVTGKLTVVRPAEAVDTPPRHSKAEVLVNLADQNEKVADALRFYERDDWINLYKAWEIVSDAAGGAHELINKGWATRKEQGRFTGTAQSRVELGDDARHASERYDPPANPMSLDEARSFVKSVIEAWISSL